MLNMLPRIFQPNEIVIKKGSLIRLKFIKGEKIIVYSTPSGDDVYTLTINIEDGTGGAFMGHNSPAALKCDRTKI